MPKKLPPSAPRKTAPRKPLDAWDREASKALKMAMLQEDFTFEMLAEALKGSGFGSTTPSALKQRVERGSFNFGFALRVLRAMNVDNLDISKVKRHTRTPSRG